MVNPIEVLIHIRIKGDMFKPSDHSKAVLLVLFMFHVCLCYASLSVPCSLVITCLERIDPLALVCMMFSFIFVTFPCGVPGQVGT